MLWLYARFLWRIMYHKYWVFRFGIKVGGIPLWRLLVHDLSKFSRAEFNPRFHHQMTGRLTKKSPEWKACVDAHHAKNGHHWQYWVRNGIPEPMPESYVREMVADWFAAKKTYRVPGDTVQSWIVVEYPKMQLHSKTSQRLIKVLSSQGVIVPAAVLTL